MQYSAMYKLILEKGVDNVDLPESIAVQVFTEAGILLAKENNFSESAKALAKANNQEELIRLGNYFSKQGRFSVASYYFYHSSDKEIIESSAFICLENGYYEDAKKLFTKLGREDMLAFIQANT
jgi:hypothetical protein